MFVINLHTKYHIPLSTGPLVMSTKFKATCKCSYDMHVVILILTYETCKGNCMFFEDHYRISYEGCAVNGVNVATMSQTAASAILLLLIIGSNKARLVAYSNI
jgi:hypothetical protein